MLLKSFADLESLPELWFACGDEQSVDGTFEVRDRTCLVSLKVELATAQQPILTKLQTHDII